MNYAEHIPLPDELVAEPPSLYRRRQKTVGVRRGGARIGVRLLKAGIFGLLLLVVLGAVGYRLAAYSASSAQFRFNPNQDVTFEGNRFVSHQDLVSALGFEPIRDGEGHSIFGLNLGAVDRRVESIPWIESATVSRLFPKRLLVSVVERKPLAFAEVSGHLVLVDKHGIFLERPHKAVFDFPVIHGLGAAANPAERERLLEPYVKFLQQAGDAVDRSGWQISEADLQDSADLQLLLVQGSETVLAHFGDQDFNQRFETFAGLAPQVIASNPRINSMDLRYPGEVVVDPATPPPVLESRTKPAQQSRGR
ncbi:MAG: cell division protein FtsQ/DivIB [Terriglobia bacterium]